MLSVGAERFNLIIEKIKIPSFAMLPLFSVLVSRNVSREKLGFRMNV